MLKQLIIAAGNVAMMRGLTAISDQVFVIRKTIALAYFVLALVHGSGAWFIL